MNKTEGGRGAMDIYDVIAICVVVAEVLIYIYSKQRIKRRLTEIDGCHGIVKGRAIKKQKIVAKV